MDRRSLAGSRVESDREESDMTEHICTATTTKERDQAQGEENN